MKFFPYSHSSDRIRAARLKSGFTLPEVLIATTLFLLLLGGIVGANLFGMRLFQLTESKLRSSDGARKTLGVMTDEIRKCKATWVGDVTNGAFVALADGLLQTGSALLIQPTTSTNNFVIYYLNPSDQSFRRSVTSTASTTILAQTVTNATIFCAQDFQGNALTNNQNNHVIHVTLEFFQPQQWLPVAEYSKLETSVSRRSLQ